MEKKVYNAETEKVEIIKQCYELQFESILKNIKLEIECLEDEVKEMKENGEDTRNIKGKIQGLKRALRTIMNTHKNVDL
ncbi:UNVERIFIED_ORG: hypothetical protein B2H93_04825 [Clostridium botulinum]